MTKILKLSQAIGTMICHDLAGSVGTIDNCLGLIGNANSSISSQAQELVFTESQHLVKHIKFLREIYSVAESNNEMSLTTLVEIIADFFKNSEVKFKAHINYSEPNINILLAKAAICLTGISSENIALTGTIDLYINDEKETIKIISNGKDLQPKKECFAVLNSVEEVPITVNNCREHYVSVLCSEINYNISAKKNGGIFEYVIMKNEDNT
jgi:hypothetical protein